MPDIATDPRYKTNKDRVANREIIDRIVADATRTRPLQSWLDELGKAGVPCGPVNTVEQAFADPQAQHRNMRLTMAHPEALNKQVDLIANPVKFSETPVSYRFHPPSLGEQGDFILKDELGLNEDKIEQLKSKGII